MAEYALIVQAQPRVLPLMNAVSAERGFFSVESLHRQQISFRIDGERLQSSIVNSRNSGVKSQVYGVAAAGSHFRSGAGKTLAEGITELGGCHRSRQAKHDR